MPQPVPQTSQGTQTSQQPFPVVPTIVTPGETQVPGQAPGQPNQLPFPATQTVITPGETQAPGQVPGQAVHEVTTTEINPTHNITTTESWLGKANETLNRTNGKLNLSVYFNHFTSRQQCLYSKQVSRELSCSILLQIFSVVGRKLARDSCREGFSYFLFEDQKKKYAAFKC